MNETYFRLMVISFQIACQSLSIIFELEIL
jgi:hypothetical protein